ncbi:Potassium channel domain [Dillenia turbinata]|uniref:Potassium channel domain n=1 Tax=Dillenia turbinata TaxID=194707 RepID=A0AAN8YWN8_9MAGN
MANDEDVQPLLTGSGPVNLSQTSEVNVIKKRRSRQNIVTAPMSEVNLSVKNDAESPPNPDSLFAQKPSLTKVLIFLALYLGVGTLCFYLVRHQLKGTKTNGIIDAIYFCVVTMTTVGYGDIVPNSILSKLLACVYVFTGMALVGMILGRAAEYFVEKQELLLVKVIHMHEKNGSDEVLTKAETKKTVKYKFLTALILLLIIMIVGVIFLSFEEQFNFFDAFYCVCSTITTLGYGDESFTTAVGRVFGVFWILSGTVCLAQFYYYLAELHTESRQSVLLNWVLTRKLTLKDLEAADLDNDKMLSPAEYVIFKLKEMGKISQEDVRTVLEGFRNLDVDHSGTLTAEDLSLAQSS